MGKIFIMYETFFDMKGESYTVGGIQTYIRQLIEVIQNRNDIPIVVQYADFYFKRKFNNVDVYGVDVHHISNITNRAKALVGFIEREFKFNENDMLIFATESIFVPTFTHKVVTIQHGIAWDLPKKDRNIRKYLIFEMLLVNVNIYKMLRRIKHIKNMVCVDNNFINWIRTQIRCSDINLFVIPNCTKMRKNCFCKEDGKIKIIFARRFEIYRGTRLFASVINKILNKHQNVYITFAGRGPEEAYLKNLFKGNSKINFITYESEKSLDIHQDYHIAVIPSIGSEGTSLSLLEAMACKCAVIATNIGGMTNIVLDSYNGLLVNPEEKYIYNAIENLIINKELREKLAENAYHTVSESFNNDLWEKRWNKVLDEICNKEEDKPKSDRNLF